MTKRTETHACHCGDHVFAFLGGIHVALVDPEDREILASRAWRAVCPHKNIVMDPKKHVHYARRSSSKNGKSYSMLLHRQVTGTKGRHNIVDHKNVNGLDCRKSNLRVGTQAGNRANGRKNRNNSSGYKGVCLHYGGRYRAYLGSDSKHIGLFDCPIEAAKAYDREAALRWGEAARLNFPELLEAAE